MNAPSNVIELADRVDGQPGALWSQDAEQSVLGCMLLDNGVADDVLPVLRGADFFTFAHRVIFEAMEALIAVCKAADPITVQEHLKRAGLDEKAGGLQYLIELGQSVHSARHAGAYARIVADMALRRSLLQAAEQAQDIAKSEETATGALDQIAALFQSIDRVRQKAEPISIADAVMARVEHWEAMQRGETVPGIPTGLSALDRALGGGLKDGRVVVLAARPSIGKTSLAQQIGLTVASRQHGVLIVSQEMGAGELVDRAAANLAQVNLGAISEGKLGDDDWPRLTAAIDDVRGLPLFIDDEPAQTLLSIRAKARNVMKRSKLALIVVDYLQLCAGTNTGQRNSRHHEIETISRGLKALSKELGVTVLLLSQINRASTQRDEPTLADLKESGAIEEDADVVIFLQPKGNLPDGSQLIAALIAKNRQGRRGRIALSFRGATQRWVESTANVSPAAPARC